MIETIKADCKYWESLSNDQSFMYLNECNNSKENGLYQLILNGRELWYGTTSEINAVVKSMIKLIEKENDFNLDTPSF